MPLLFTICPRIFSKSRSKSAESPLQIAWVAQKRRFLNFLMSSRCLLGINLLTDRTEQLLYRVTEIFTEKSWPFCGGQQIKFYIRRVWQLLIRMDQSSEATSPLISRPSTKNLNGVCPCVWQRVLATRLARSFLDSRAREREEKRP